MKKIALLGSAPSSVKLAPYGDPSFEIWGCSPGAIMHATRIDRWFEMHAWLPENPCCEKNYVERLAKLGKPVYMVNPVPEIPTSVSYPKEAILAHEYGKVVDDMGVVRPAKFNPNDFRSTVSWMLAMAIMEKPDVIVLCGVDMAADDEYGGQKDGCLALIHIAKSIGIIVDTPFQSDLIRPAPLYGYCEHSHPYVKLTARKRELEGQVSELEMHIRHASERLLTLRGAISDLGYMLNTWVEDPQAIQMAYSQPDIPRSKARDDAKSAEEKPFDEMMHIPVQNLVKKRHPERPVAQAA